MRSVDPGVGIRKELSRFGNFRRKRNGHLCLCQCGGAAKAQDKDDQWRKADHSVRIATLARMETGCGKDRWLDLTIHLASGHPTALYRIELYV